MKRNKEPKTMTFHDYKEVWNFLFIKGMDPNEIPPTGIGAWREAKRRGFVESEFWGEIPGKSRSLTTDVSFLDLLLIIALATLVLSFFFN